MAVALDESGNDELPLQIDHARRRADVALELGTAAERDDSVTAHRDSFCLRHAVVDGDDSAVRQHQVRCGDWRLLTRPESARHDDEERTRAHQDHC